MSGSAGGNRIARNEIFNTINSYTDNVLNKYPVYQKSIITGSFNQLHKNEFGDIDLIVQFNSYDKIQEKKDFIKFLMSFSKTIIVPFKNEKYLNKRYLNTGEIVTILYPISNSNKFVQIDNIFSISNEETIFKNEFLSLPAIKQGLLLGLIKTSILENPSIIEKFNFNLPNLNENEEFEFNLSSKNLTLRKVTLSSDYKTLNKDDLYSFIDWNYVKSICPIKINQSFEEIVKDIKRLKHPRSIFKIKGIFKSMVSIKSGEIGTEKANEKQYALDIISAL